MTVLVCRDAKGQQRRGYFLDDLFHLRVSWVKRGRIILAAPLDSVRIDLGLLGIDEVTAEGVVVRRARGWIQTHRLLNFVDAAPDRLDGGLHLVRQIDRSSLV